MTTRRHFIKTSVAAGAGTFLLAAESLQDIPQALASVQVPQEPLPGEKIKKFKEALPTFFGKRMCDSSYTVSIEEFQQKVLPDECYVGLQPPYQRGTYLRGYKIGNRPNFFPGYTVEAIRGRPTVVTYENNLPRPAFSRLEPLLTIDQTIHWADPLQRGDSYTMEPYKGPIPVSVHLHGAEVSSLFDGSPNQWFTPDGRHGKAYATYKPTAANSTIYCYPNVQEATTLFFHDHALGITRLNVFAGLVAGYLLRDRYDTGLSDNPLRLPSGPQEIELLIQDKQFDTNGQLFFPDSPSASPMHSHWISHSSSMHPYWISHFLGDVIVVNGRSWPYLQVEPRRYRFRFVNVANARAFRMRLVDAERGGAGPTFWQIGTDGGLLDFPVQLDDTKDPLYLAPAERADIIVDFTNFAGLSLTLVNDAPVPFPNSPKPDPATSGLVMQFRVTLPLSHPDTSYNPAHGGSLRGGKGQPPAIVRLANPRTGGLAYGVMPTVKRQLVLMGIFDSDGNVLELLMNNTNWDGLNGVTDTPVAGSKPGTMGQGIWLTELPEVGATEVWEIIHLGLGIHPIHIHLIQFQVLNRQDLNVNAYQGKYNSLFPDGTYVAGYGPPLPYNKPNEDGALGGNPAVGPYLEGPVQPPAANEAGWKDTLKAPPGQVTRLVARWAPLEVPVNRVKPGQNLYSFDPTVGPGYVWHCHILDHEDNEMMRPYSPVWRNR